MGKKSNFEIRSIDKLTYVQGKFILFQLRFKNPLCSNKLKIPFIIVLRDTLWPINKLINAEIRFVRANPSLTICFGSIFSRPSQFFIAINANVASLRLPAVA
ncbi:hypothetical protein BN2127_JRS10_04976 [Bacillus subtilis]|nr:hypothetical protein BN2127_JRS10_04976 [Bacillus subtilis]